MFGRGSRDPGHGIRYNNISDNWRASKKLYSFDIARTPIVVKDYGQSADLQGYVNAANGARLLIDKRQDRVEGRFHV